tara:strand:+ start:1269 stop:1457 length:189 start_codon:yes stop_codon:yes gene_type:complete
VFEYRENSNKTLVFLTHYQSLSKLFVIAEPHYLFHMPNIDYKAELYVTLKSEKAAIKKIQAT